MRGRKPLTAGRIIELFSVLGINIRQRWDTRGADQYDVFQKAKDDAKKRYRELALKLHPDHGGDIERFKEINAAWTILQKVEMRPNSQPVRKSALTVDEVRGPAHTTVFVGVVTNQTTNSQFTPQPVWQFTPGTGGF